LRYKGRPNGTQTTDPTRSIAYNAHSSPDRVKQPNKPFPPHTQQDLDTRLAEISTCLASIVPDLQSINRQRYTSPLRCLEELVEALSFAHYLRTQTLITPAQTRDAVPATRDIDLTEHDYMYGLFDLFGEMMRFATVTTAQTGELVGKDEVEEQGSGGDVSGAGPRESTGRRRTILSDMQELGCAFEMLPGVPTKDYRGKMETMRQSVKKVEKLGYGLVVRGRERPKGWLPDMKEEEAAPASPS
jgi:hypothetical protein